MDEELKACPHCGEPGVTGFDNGGQFLQKLYGCGACLLWCSTPEEWNTRPVEDALRAEVERLREAARWISVEERLPEIDYNDSVSNTIEATDGTDVWCPVVYVGEPTSLGGRLFTRGWWHHGKPLWAIITHWRPLPEPPQEPQPGGEG